MKINTSVNYEVHRPLELAPEHYEHVKAMLSPEEFQVFEKSRERAGTAGPIFVGGQISRMPGRGMDELYDKALMGGANPCYMDEETGQIFLGHFVFVPIHPED